MFGLFQKLWNDFYPEGPELDFVSRQVTVMTQKYSEYRIAHTDIIFGSPDFIIGDHQSYRS